MGILGLKSHGIYNALIFPAREVDLPSWKNTFFFYLLVVGNRGPLLLVCSNVHVSGESSIFGNAFSMDF